MVSSVLSISSYASSHTPGNEPRSTVSALFHFFNSLSFVLSLSTIVQALSIILALDNMVSDEYLLQIYSDDHLEQKGAIWLWTLYQLCWCLLVVLLIEFIISVLLGLFNSATPAAGFVLLGAVVVVSILDLVSYHLTVTLLNQRF
jgi:hypothetical protein